MSDSPSHTDSPEASALGGASSTFRLWGRRAAWIVGVTGGALLLLIGSVLLGLQTETGATAAARWLASSANPLSGTQLTIERASGSWLRSIQLTGVRLTRTDASGTTVSMAEADTIAARYDLLPLLRGRLHMERLSVVGPALTMRQAADSTWDWSRVLPASEEPATPDTSAGMSIRIDSVRVARGAFIAAFHAEERDSTARVHDLQVRARDFEFASALSFRLDTLGLNGRLPGDPTDLQLAARGALSPSGVTLDTLRLDSPRSRVRGHGTVHLPAGSHESVEDVSFSLQATPFALRDLTLIAPTLDIDPKETVRLDVRGSGSGRQLTATANARFSGGGTVTARADATPTTTTTAEGPPLHYQLNAQLRRLTTSLLGPPDSTRNRLNATLALDVQGRSLAALSGTADLELTDTRWTDLRTPRLTLASTLRDGTASLDLRGTLNDAELTATGRARPLSDTVSADVRARIRAFDVAAFAPDAGVKTNLAATTEIRARALGTANQTVDLSLALDSSRVGRQDIVGGQVALALQPERARFSGELALPAGQVQADGFADLDGTERFALETARLNRVNVAALTGDSTASRLTGTARVEGRGFAPEAMRLDAVLALEESFYGPYRLSSLSTEARLNRGRLTTTTDATLNGGVWTLAVEGQPFAPEPAYEITRGRFRSVDIGPFLQDTTQSSRLDGTVQGGVQGTDPATMTVDAGLTLDTSRVNQQRIDAASLDLRLRSARLDTDLTVETPEGGVRLSATARPFDETPVVQVTEGTFDDLDVGRIAGLAGLSTALSGSLSVSGRGASASALTLDAGLSFAESRINDATLSNGRLDLQAATGRATVDGRFAVDGGTVDVNGTADSLDTTPAYGLRTTVRSLDAGALAGLDTLSARIDSLQWTLDGRGTSLSTLTASTQLAARHVRVDRFTLDTVDVAGVLRGGQLALDALRIRSNVFESRGQGTLAITDTAATSEFSLRTEITNTGPIQRLLGATTFQLRRGVLETNVYGSSLASQRFDGTVELEGLAYDDVRLTEAALTFNGVRGCEKWIRQFELNGSLGYLSLPSFSTEETTLRATSDGSTVDVSTQVRLDPTHSADLAATIAPGADQTDVTLSQLDLRLDDRKWSLLQPATLSISDHYRVRGLLLHSGDQQIAADGVVDLSGTQNFVVTVEEVQVGTISPLVGLPGVDGTLTGSLDLTGPAAAPVLESRLALDLRTENRPVGTLRLTTRYQDLALDLNAELTHTDGRRLTAVGTVPTDLRLQASAPADVASQPVRIDVSTEEFPLDWVDPFLDPETVRNVQGLLAADVRVRGTLDSPELAGMASLSGGGAVLPALNTRYQGGTGTFRFTDNRIVLEGVAIESDNDGRLRAEGVINFPQLTVGEYDLKLNASDFLAIDTRAYRQAVIDGGMNLRGTIQRPVLNGTLEVQSANIYYNEALAETAASTSAVPLSETDQLTLENRFGIRLAAADTTTFDAYEALKMDLTVRIQRNTWLRSRSNPEMNVQFTGDLDLSKAHDEDPQIFGSIQVVTERSTLRQFGQEFQITEGTLTFNGDPYTPFLNLAAVYEQRAQRAQGSEVSITLRLEGRPENLSPTLSSDPPMDTRNILSYLATGRPADELLSGGGGGRGNLATQVALGQASNFVENLAASELGLDVVRVQLRTTGVSYLTVGRYFTPRLFVSVEQPVTSADPVTSRTTQYLPDLTVEYQLLDTLMLRVLNNQQSLQLNLLFEYAY